MENLISFDKKISQIKEFQEYLDSQFFEEEEIKNIIECILTDDKKLLKKVFNRYNFDKKFKEYFLEDSITDYYINIVNKNKNIFEKDIYDKFIFFLNNKDAELNFNDMMTIIKLSKDNKELLEVIEYINYCSSSS